MIAPWRSVTLFLKCKYDFSARPRASLDGELLFGRTPFNSTQEVVVKLSPGSIRVLDSWKKLAILVAATAAAACGGGDDDTGTNPTPAIGISISPTTLSLAQGANNTVTATVSRSGGFAGNIDLSIENLPTGATATFSPTSVASAATTSTVTITARHRRRQRGPTPRRFAPKEPA